MRRVGLLAFRLNWASKARFILLTAIAAVGMTVFLIVSELSHLSSEDLRESVSEEAGQTGTYAIDFSSTMGMSAEDLATRIRTALTKYSARPIQMVEIIPALNLDCPPGTILGGQPLLIPRAGNGSLADFVHGEPLPAGAQVCLGGEEIPPSDVRVPTRLQQAQWLGVGRGSPMAGLLIRGRYEPLARLATTGFPSYRFIVVTDQDADQSFALTTAIDDQLDGVATMYGELHLDSVFGVSRLDTAQAIRRAAEGVYLVYAVIAWGVLALGGLGLLVAEMIVVRDRTWFFGLSRAIGGRALHVAALVVVDILLVLVAGSAAAIGLVLVLQPFAESFAQSSFQVAHVSFLQASVVPRLVLGELVVLLLAGVYPATKAVRQDPLDVLEPRIS